MQNVLSKFIAHPRFYRYLTISFLCCGGIFCFVYLFAGILLPFLIAFLGAYLLNSSVTNLEKYKIPRGVGSAFMVLSLIFGILLIIGLVVPTLQKELFHFVNQLPTVLKALEGFILHVAEKLAGFFSPQDFSHFKQQVAQYIGEFIKWIANIIMSLFTQGLIIANVVSIVILTPLVMYYILRDWSYFVKSFQRIFPESYRDRIISVMIDIDETLKKYLKGQFFICFLLMMLYTFFLTLFKIPQSFLIGFITGLFSFIPYGGCVGILLSIAFLLSYQDPWNLLGNVFIIFSLLTIFEGKVLIPRLIGERIGIHPVWMLFSLFSGAHILGFWGLVFAVPIAVVISTILRFLQNNT